MHLKEQGGIEQVNDVLGINLNATCVDEIEKAFHCPRRDVLNVDLAVTCFFEIAREHRTKISRGGAQDHLVTREFDALDVDVYVGEERLVLEFEQVLARFALEFFEVNGCGGRRGR